jgi:hypothetical protein
MHGHFLNDERGILHRNLAVHGFGSYGDAFIRDRKMYVFKHVRQLSSSATGASSSTGNHPAIAGSASGRNCTTFLSGSSAWNNWSCSACL